MTIPNHFHIHMNCLVCLFLPPFCPSHIHTHTIEYFDKHCCFFSWNFHIEYVRHVRKNEDCMEWIGRFKAPFSLSSEWCFRVCVLPFANNLINLIYTFRHFDRNRFIFILGKNHIIAFFRAKPKILLYICHRYDARKFLLIDSYFYVVFFTFLAQIKWKRMSKRIFEKGKLRIHRIHRDGVRDGISPIWIFGIQFNSIQFNSCSI